jgi:regulator of cell morphogenesis and NO signaling
MTELSLSNSVGQLVTERPSRSRVLSRLGIDFCCGGKKSLGDACREGGFDGAEVLALLQAQEEPGEAPSELATASLASICDHLEKTHHAYLKEELPRLEEMLEKVTRVHGERFPYVAEVMAIFVPFAEDLLLHLHKEERVLFPAIRRIERGGHVDVAAPIGVMEREHDEAGEVLRRVRALTNDYAPPDGACNTFRALLAGLEELETDLHQHVHVENNILFPRAREAR